MKVVPLSEAKAKLNRYDQLCHHEPVVVTVNGRPFFQLVPLQEDDDLVLQKPAEAWTILGQAIDQLHERSVSMDTVSRRLAATVSPRVRKVRLKAVRIEDERASRAPSVRHVATFPQCRVLSA